MSDIRYNIEGSLMYTNLWQLISCCVFGMFSLWVLEFGVVRLLDSKWARRVQNIYN